MNPPARPPSRRKLTRPAEFETVFSTGHRSADSLFTVLYRPSALPEARLGMTASARRVRTSVGRNRIRRLVRESFRHARRSLAAVDIVVVVKEPAARASNAAIFASLERHWGRLRRSEAEREADSNHG